MSASDAYGLIGSAATSITLALSARELSKFILNDGTGTNYQTFTSPLDTAELSCGPWNGTDHFLPEAWSNYSSYQPLIVLPSKLIAMVPAWKSCTADMFEGQDPPRTLSPAAAMAPAPTNVGTQAQNNAASPSPSIPALPHKTGAGVSQQKDPDPDPSPNSPSKPVDPSTGTSGDPSNSNPSPKPSDPSTGDSGDSSSDNLHPKPNDPWSGGSGVPNDSQDPAGNAASAATAPALDPTQAPAGDPPSNGPSNPSAADLSDTKNTPLTLPPAILLHGHTITQGAAPVTMNEMPVVYQSGSISAEGEVKAIPPGWGQGIGNASPMTVGGLIFSAIPFAAKAEGDPQIGNEHPANTAQINDSAAANADPATYITIGDHTIAVDANSISVAGKTLKPGDPGVTIDGTPISLGSSIFVVGSRTETLSPPQAAITAQPPYTIVGGQRVRVSSNAIIVDGTTLKSADPGITVDGTLVSLGSSILVVGTHTQNLVLPQPTPSPAPSYMTVGGETIAVAANGIVVAGHTVTPGGPVVTADGTLVSLGSSVLIVGTQTTSFALPTASASMDSSQGIGAMILKGLGGIGVGTVATPTHTVGYNGTMAGNGTMMFMGDGKKNGLRFKGWVAWVWTVLVFMI